MQKRLSLLLPCALDDSEIRVLADDLILHEDRAEQLKLDASETAKKFKDDITAEQVSAGKAKAQIRSRTRECEVACREYALESENMVVTLRLDTGAEVARRAMEESEKQGSLLDTVGPIDDADLIEHDHIASLFSLADLLQEADVKLGRNLQPLWQLTEAQASEGRLWVIAKRDLGPDEVPPPMPAWLSSLVEESRQKEMAADGPSPDDATNSATGPVDVNLALPTDEAGSQIDLGAAADAARSNGSLSRGDLCDKILECGVTVRIEKVEAWTAEQAQTAEQWVKDSLGAIANGTTRKAAPEFFFEESANQ